MKVETLGIDKIDCFPSLFSTKEKEIINKIFEIEKNVSGNKNKTKKQLRIAYQFIKKNYWIKNTKWFRNKCQIYFKNSRNYHWWKHNK